MGEAESLNEMVRNAGGYADPSIATTVVNALMLAGERQSACAVARKTQLAEGFASRAEAACRLLEGDTAAALPAGQIDGPSMMAIDLTRAPVPAGLLRATQPSIIRSLVTLKALPMATRLDIAERGEALAIIEATRLGDLYLEALRDGAALPPAIRAGAPRWSRPRATRPMPTRSPIRWSRSMARRAAGRCSRPSRGPAPSACSTCRRSRNSPTWRRKRCAASCCSATGNGPQAWLQLALSAVTNNARAIIALDRLVPLAAVAGVEESKLLTPVEINRWYELMREDDAARAPLRGYLLLELLRATGIDLPPRSTDLPEAAPGNARLVMPNAATLQALATSAAARRRAETALLASIAAAETPLGELHPAGIAAIVRALLQVGRGRCRTPVRDRDRDRLWPLAVKAKRIMLLSPRGGRGA